MGWETRRLARRKSNENSSLLGIGQQTFEDANDVFTGTGPVRQVAFIL
jgi:hypothetical protein